jgi:hypothetical protein
MRISVARLPVLAVLGLLVTPVLPGLNSAAQAQSIQIGPGGVQVNPQPEFRREPRWRVSERDAVRIARRYGIDDVNRVAHADREWRVSGTSRRGGFIRVVVDARSGDVVRVVRGG